MLSSAAPLLFILFNVNYIYFDTIQHVIFKNVFYSEIIFLPELFDLSCLIGYFNMVVIILMIVIYWSLQLILNK
jgi:hypothetical protein